MRSLLKSHGREVEQERKEFDLFSLFLPLPCAPGLEGFKKHLLLLCLTTSWRIPDPDNAPSLVFLVSYRVFFFGTKAAAGT